MNGICPNCGYCPTCGRPNSWHQQPLKQPVQPDTWTADCNKQYLWGDPQPTDVGGVKFQGTDPDGEPITVIYPPKRNATT